MASATQQQGFITQYYPLAEQVANETGDSSSEILSQWALETGWGTGMAGQNNLGNVMSNGSDLNYSTANAGAQAYADVLKEEGVVNDAGNTSAFANALDAGHYAGDQVGYGQSVTALIPTVDTMEANQTSGTQSTSSPSLLQEAANAIPGGFLGRVVDPVGSIFKEGVDYADGKKSSGCAFSIDDPVTYFICEGANIILIIIGVVIVLFAIDSFIRSSMMGTSMTKVSNTYQTTTGLAKGAASGVNKAKGFFTSAAGDAADVAVVAA